LKRRDNMFWFLYLFIFIFFLYVIICIFQLRKHPFTILAFSGATSYSIVMYELLHFSSIRIGDVVLLLFAIFFSIFSTYLFKQKAQKTAKALLIQSLFPTAFVLSYTLFYEIPFLSLLFLMSITTPVIVPKSIKEKRKHLLFSSNN
jgi:hypothetical protein